MAGSEAVARNNLNWLNKKPAGYFADIKKIEIKGLFLWIDWRLIDLTDLFYFDELIQYNDYIQWASQHY